MRRVLLPALCALALLGGAACAPESGDGSGAEFGRVAAGVVDAMPSSPPPDYTADTAKVCAEVEKFFDGKQMENLAEDLGMFVAYSELKQTRLAARARTASGKRFTETAARFRQITGKAQDPEFRAAGQKSATSIAAAADDDKLFASLSTQAKFEKNFEKTFLSWFMPIAPFCS